MTPHEVDEALGAIRSKFGKWLENQHLNVLHEAAHGAKREYQELVTAAGRKKELRGRWGYVIPLDAPLTFRTFPCRKVRLQADISCQVHWEEPQSVLCDQKVTVRVWSHDSDVLFRDEFDTENVIAGIKDNRRVMLRFHFDMAAAEQQGPRYHMQVGGRSRPEEACWLHPQVNLPRFPYQPMDLVLACELVVANFLPEEARRQLRDAGWRRVLAASQKSLLKPYYGNHCRVVGQRASLLNHLTVGASSDGS